HRLDDVEELALVFVDALDLDVEERVRVEPEPGPLADHRGEPLLVAALDPRELLPETAVIDVGLERAQTLGILHDAVADRLPDEIVETRIALHEPAPRRDAVRLVADALGMDPVQVAE